MPRPRNQRRVGCEPNITYFKPRGVPVAALDTIALTIDELEALRLKDYRRLDQNDAAEQMHVSQPTFHRIVNAARNKVADALVNGKAIKIEGGDYLVKTERLFKCNGCGHEWSEPFGTGRPSDCPKCGSPDIYRHLKGGGSVRFGLGRRNRGRRSE